MRTVQRAAVTKDAGPQGVEMDRGSRILAADYVAPATVWFWFETETEVPRVTRFFQLFKTGADIPWTASYQASTGSHELHLFEVTGE